MLRARGLTAAGFFIFSRQMQVRGCVGDYARDIAASISSGSFKTAGMVILPCSMKTLSGIVHSYTDGLLTRAADVVLKERRPLVLCVRETPFHLGHLRLLVQAAEMGAVIMPPVSPVMLVSSLLRQTCNLYLTNLTPFPARTEKMA